MLLFQKLNNEFCSNNDLISVCILLVLYKKMLVLSLTRKI